jgi:hypothetical protein
MCDKNIDEATYYHGGKPVHTTANIDGTTRSARRIAEEVQRDSYGALADNLAAAQRRSIGLAEGALEFVRLQEENAGAAQRFFAEGLRLVHSHQRNAEFVGGWTGDFVEAVRQQSEHNVRTAEALARSASEQQEAFGKLARGWAQSYVDFFWPLGYLQEGLKASQRVARQGLEATEQLARQGLRVAEEAAETTEEVLKRTEGVTREAELGTAVRAALGTADYEGSNVEQVSKRLEGLSTEELGALREYEKHNKDRETLIEQIDRKIRANS